MTQLPRSEEEARAAGAVQGQVETPWAAETISEFFPFPSSIPSDAQNRSGKPRSPILSGSSGLSSSRALVGPFSRYQGF